MLAHSRSHGWSREATVLSVVLVGGTGWGTAACSEIPSSSSGGRKSAAPAGTGSLASAGAGSGGTGGFGNSTSTSGGMNAAGGGGTPMVGTAGAATSETAARAPVLSALLIEPNPTNTLSCFVSWTTDVASSSEVQFGVDECQFHIV